MSDAAYIALGEHTRDVSRPLAGFGVVVGDFGIPVGMLELATDQGTICLSSVNAQFLTLAGPDSRFYLSLRDAMWPFVLRDQFGPVGADGENGVYFDFSDLAGADAYAAWIAAHIAPGRGVYVDDCTATIPPRRLDDLPTIAVGAMVAGWPVWRDRFLSQLRARLPAALPIVANTAGWMSPVLSGICVEASHAARMGLLMTLARYAIQWTRGRRPVVQIDWSGRWSFPLLGLYRGVFLPGVRTPDA